MLLAVLVAVRAKPRLCSSRPDSEGSEVRLLRKAGIGLSFVLMSKDDRPAISATEASNPDCLDRLLLFFLCRRAVL